MQEGFVDLSEVIPQLKMDIRYATAHNLTGHPLAGYCRAKAIMTVQGAAALKKAFETASSLGYGMLIYDAYRPQKAVNDFAKWSGEPQDHMTKDQFYPQLEKDRLFDLGYIAMRSGHSRGSTVDLTLTRDGIPVDMGTCFDRMSDLSHHNSTGVSEQAQMNRAVLCGIMAYAGFSPYECEWWHYTLMDEPWQDTYFDFDIV